MRYQEIPMVGGGGDGQRYSSNDEHICVNFTSSNMWLRAGDPRNLHRPPYEVSNYELVALTVGQVDIVFYKEVSLSIEDAVSRLVNEYGSRR